MKPSKYKANFNRHKIYKYLAFIWLTSMVTQGYVRYSKCTCSFIPLSTILLNKHIETTVITAYVSITFFFPTLVTWVAFIHIYFRVSKYTTLKENRGRRGRRALLRMCAITSLVLAVCCFPTEVCYIINQYGYPVLNFGTSFREFTVLLALSNSFVNPQAWIYPVSNRRYRHILTLCFR